MTRLRSELHRLYLPSTDADGRVRAMMLSLAAPADWTALSRVWQAVQTDLSLPAPAIAVSGEGSYQLWFSLAEAVPVHEARAFLAMLRDRHLADLAPARVGLHPMAADAEVAGEPVGWPAHTLPPRLVREGQWSAFVAPDLAPIFADTPWLDIEPSPEGQADLLSRLQSIKAPAWQAALPRDPTATSVAAPVGPGSPLSPRPAAGADPRAFLLGVMNDGTVPLALRIEAAKALLPFMTPDSAP